MKRVFQFGNRANGFSKSAWKSLAVKSLRIGWPAGLARAQAALGKSDTKLALTSGVFEDVFPSVAELTAVMQEARQLDYVPLCLRQTHHARGLTAEFCRLEPEAVAAARTRQAELYAKAREHGIFMPPRAMNCWWTWLAMAPQEPSGERTVDQTPWTGMPECILDGHTYEGRAARRIVTLLSGSYANHLKLSKLVAEIGWEGIRQRVHSKVEPERGHPSMPPTPQAEFGF